MDPKLWGQLPFHIVEYIAQFADLDTRRALGIFDKLPKTNFVFRPLSVCSWRYWPSQKKTMFFNAFPGEYEFEVHEGIIWNGEHWSYEEKSAIWIVVETPKQIHLL
jgi:hypothetical protein